MTMPELPDELFIGSLAQLLAVDEAWVPAAAGQGSIYLRPFMIGTEVGLGVRAPAECLYVLIAAPVESSFPDGVDPVDVWLAVDHIRELPRRVGNVKRGGNYAASLPPRRRAAENGCAQVAYLDAREQCWVEEMGNNNIFLVFGRGTKAELVTPELSDHIVPGVTRDSVLVLAKELGYRVTERKVSVGEWLEGAEDGRITEVFGSGTTVGIGPVGGVKHPGGSVRIGDGRPGPVTMLLRELLGGIQRGVSPDTHHWMHPLVPVQAHVSIK